MRQILLFVALLLCNNLFAQELTVKSLKAAVMDISASHHERMTDEGLPCALLKVMTVDDITQAEGGNIGNIEKRGTEKWIYLDPASSQLTIILAAHKPLTIRFADYGIERLQGKNTYELVLIEDDRHVERFTIGGVSFNMVQVDGGSFMMGYEPPHPFYNPDYKGNPGHKVILSTFMIGETEVTQALWQSVMDNNPSEHKGNTHPVEHVSWNDCKKFIEKLNKLTGSVFRLPTEAEWEFAARGGNKSQGTVYSGSDNIDVVTWWRGNAQFTTHPVRQKLPNELGLYDLSGNVREWCQDWYESISPFAPPQRNPHGPDKPTGLKERVSRGGSAISHWTTGEDCLIHNRQFQFKPSYRGEEVGFRLAMSVQ